MDSNHRRHSRRIYSPLHLAALQPSQNNYIIYEFAIKTIKFFTYSSYVGALRWNRTTDTAPHFNFSTPFCFAKFPLANWLLRFSKITSIFENFTYENPCVNIFSQQIFIYILIVCWCPKVESNHRHKDFQSFALPTELSGHLNFKNSSLVLFFCNYNNIR